MSSICKSIFLSLYKFITKVKKKSLPLGGGHLNFPTNIFKAKIIPLNYKKKN